MADLRDYVNRKVDDRFRFIDEKLKNSFQAIKADIGSIKSSLKERKEMPAERPEKINEKLNEKLDRELEKSISELKAYFKDSVSGLKKELNEALENTKATKPEVEELKGEIEKLKTIKKKDNSTEDVSRFKKIIDKWKEKYKRRKSYERYLRNLKEKEIEELKKKEYEKAREKAKLEREHQRKLDELKRREYEEAKEKTRLEQEHQKQLEELDRKHKEFEEGIINRTREIGKLYNGVLSKEQTKFESQRKEDLNYLEEIRRGEAREKAKLEQNHRRQLEELDRKHNDFEEKIIHRTKEIEKLYSGFSLKEKNNFEEQRKKDLEYLKKKQSEEAREKSRIEREYQRQLEDLDRKHQEFEKRTIERAKDLDRLYGGVLSKEQGKLEEQRKKDLDYLEQIKREEYKEKARIGRDYQRKLEEQKEREIAIIKQKSALERLKKEPKLRKFQISLMGERKFFFSLLFIGLLLLAIFSLFKSPLDFPGLTGKAFWSFIIIASIIALYYVGFFDFLKSADSLRKEEIKKEELSQPVTRSDSENRARIIVNGNKKQVYKKGWFSSIADNLADEPEPSKPIKILEHQKSSKQIEKSESVKKESGKGLISSLIDSLSDNAESNKTLSQQNLKNKKSSKQMKKPDNSRRKSEKGWFSSIADSLADN